MWIHGLTVIALLVCSTGCRGERQPASSQTSDPRPVEATAAEKSGVVVGRAPSGQESARTIVILKPKAADQVLPPAGDIVMDQVQLTFVPDTLFARTNYPLVFKNSDDEMHNMNVKDSSTRTQALNVGIPPGAIYSYTFKEDGLYQVTCDVHPAMSATIVVSSTPFAALTNPDGTFQFTEVPAGTYEVTAYAGKQRVSKTVEVGSGHTDVQIDGQP
jgi:plastocyanin